MNALPLELIELVWAYVPDSDFFNCYPCLSSTTNIFDSQSFWITRAWAQHNYNPSDFHHRSILEKYLPLPDSPEGASYWRYVELVSRESVVPPSLIFLSVKECLNRAARTGLWNLFIWFEKQGKTTNHYFLVQEAIMASGHVSMLDHYLEMCPPSTWDTWMWLAGPLGQGGNPVTIRTILNLAIKYNQVISKDVIVSAYLRNGSRYSPETIRAFLQEFRLEQPPSWNTIIGLVRTGNVPLLQQYLSQQSDHIEQHYVPALHLSVGLSGSIDILSFVESHIHNIDKESVWLIEGAINNSHITFLDYLIATHGIDIIRLNGLDNINIFLTGPVQVLNWLLTSYPDQNMIRQVIRDTHKLSFARKDYSPAVKALVTACCAGAAV